MKKKDLVGMLESYDDKEEIYFSYPAEDYWHNTIVKPVKDIDYHTVENNKYFGELVLSDNSVKIVIVIS
jgi:hypothetical protein